jgi:ankyrin repeat protein
MKQNGSCCTPIMVAALKGDMEAVVILLQADADVTIKSS